MHLTSKSARIYVAGHRGLAGSAIVRQLKKSGYTNLILRGREELDLRSQPAVRQFFQEEMPEYVILAAAKVGGILANDRYPADFIVENLSIQSNVIEAAHASGVQRLLFLGSSCIYPRHAAQPLKEEYLLTGPLESTNEWYAVAKIAGIKMCQAYRKQYGDDFIAVMPTNLFGPGDNYSLETSHVLAALIRKFDDARGVGGDGSGQDAPVVVWGTGTPRREFLYSDDLAAACRFILEQPEERLYGVAPDGLINVGVGEDISIHDLAVRIRQVVGSSSPIRFDTSQPDGTPRKLLDVSRLQALGWTVTSGFDDRIRQAYMWYLENVAGRNASYSYSDFTSFI